MGGFREVALSQSSYVKTIKSLDPELTALGVQWLQATVDTLCTRADALLPSLGICAPGKR